MSASTGNVVTLKDISNVQTSLRSKSDKNDLNALVTKLKSIEVSYTIHCDKLLPACVLCTLTIIFFLW